MKNSKLKTMLATVAPTLATALGGPLAGVAAQAITAKLTGTASPDLSKVDQLLTGATGDDMVRLKELELEFAATMEQAGVDLATVDASDRASARDRAVKMKDWTPAVLGVLIMLGFFGILGYILRYGLPDQGGEVLLIMIGGLAALTTQVANFFFGSSAGSKSKDGVIADLKRAVG